MIAQAKDALRLHWPEYLMEAGELGLFMTAACFIVALLEHPASFVQQAIASPMVRRVLIGLAMGLTAISLIYSPWGKQSGAHFNPAVTLTFLRLRKIAPWDAVFYIAAQFVGGVMGVLFSFVALGGAVSHPAVRYAATLPGIRGPWVAFVAEIAITFLLMSVVLNASNSVRFSRFTGLFAGVLVATYISLESPLSGMSMNPARSLASALPGGIWDALWVYFTAPPIGMLMAAEFYVRVHGAKAVICAKLNHQNDKPCIFRCGYRDQPQQVLAMKTSL